MIRGVGGVLPLLLAAGLVAAPAMAQTVTLRIVPPVGDTLRMQLQQRFEMESGEPPETMSGEMRVWTRAIVLQRARGYTDLLSVTDSVRVFPSNVRLRPLREAQRALEGRVVRLRVDESGGMNVGGDGGVLGAGAQMPSMLPSHPVAVGHTWVRDMQIPLSTSGPSTADVRTTFRLDSLTARGTVAYVSFHGAVTHDHSQDGPGTVGKTFGTIEGKMQVDRRLGWITDSQMIVNVVSDVHPAGRQPIHARMRITQSLMELVGN